MNHFTPHAAFSRKRILWTAILFIMGSLAYTQSQMYGDTIFWENFGTGTTRSDITGLGKIGGMYKYEGPINYVYALNPTLLENYKTANPSKNYITGTVTFHDVPILTTSAQYAVKPTSTDSTAVNQYFKMTSWRNRTFSSVYTGNTQTVPAWDDIYLTTSSGYESAIPCAWLWVNGEWKFGFYYITYENTSRTAVPDDGHYALINDLGNFGVDWLPSTFKDHSGFVNTTVSPITPDSPRVANDIGRMLFVNCAAVSGITSPVYKRLVTELCRDAWFEFSVWVASCHMTTNNSQFRIEFWSADPGNDPSLGDLDSTYEGLTIANANNAKLFKVGTITSGILHKWEKITEKFKLTDQDYVWVVVRNYGAGGTGNDIALDDLVFRPWAPFDLTVELSPSSVKSACVDGLVTLLSHFPADSVMPKYIDITEYAFYFQGLRNGTWYDLGNAIPLQTQSSHIPLELTLPLSEYNLYSKFRLAVASTPTGFGGKCVTFIQVDTDKQPIGDSPQFEISGKDVCDDGSGTQQGTFIIKNTNQSNCEGWQVKVKMPDGTLKTYMPSTKATCP